jgi:hypothetical protein
LNPEKIETEENMKNKKLLICCITIFFALAMVSQAAFAEETVQEKNWEFNLTPLYLWMAGIEGDTTLGQKNNSTKADFSELFDNLEGAFSINFSGMHKSNFGFMFDYVYLSVSANKVTRLGTNLDVGLTTTLSQLAGLYRFGSEQHAFDAVAGIRYLGVEVDVSLGRLPISLSEEASIVDPIIGMRYKWNIADKWDLKLYGDIGGFGIGSAFTWQALWVVDFWPWQHVGFTGGYRALNHQFENEKGATTFELDLLLHGPILGVSFRWK